MVVPTPQPLRTAPAAAPAAPSPEQARFDRLSAQVGAARDTLAAWHAEVPRYHQAHLRRLEPLLAEIRALGPAMVRALDALLNEPGWSRAEASLLVELVCERAARFADAEDAELAREMRAVVEKHAGRPAGPAARPDDDADPDRFDRERDAAAAARRDARRARAAERRRGAAAQQAGPSLREVYRRLASALHPDREPDPERRAARTAQMQRVNQAYAAHDLLALLELQAAIEVGDPRAADGAGRLGPYNKILAEQLAGLKREIAATQARFELDFGLEVGRPLDPRKLDPLVDQGWRELSALRDALRLEASQLASPALARPWLKARARAGRRGAADVAWR